MKVFATCLAGYFVIRLFDGPQWAAMIGGWILVVLVKQVER